MSVPVKEGEKIKVSVIVPTNSGVAGAFSFTNYYMGSGSDYYNEHPNVLRILYQDNSFGCLINPETYTQIEGVKYLIIDEEMQKKAEEVEIDWYEVWPSLEEVIVYE